MGSGRSSPAVVRQPARVTVADVMAATTNVSEPDAPAREIVYRMLTLGQREIVVALGERPLGVITSRDLMSLLDTDGDGGPQRADQLLPPRASRLIPELDLSTAAAVMTTDDLEALPVVDHRGALLGVLAQRHLVRHFASAAER
jgi:CBS domain-containing protein